MRSVWNGSISFGLVSIPIKLYPAIEQQAFSFHMLHEKDYAPIEYKKFCSKEKKEVEWKDITKGIEISKDRYYVVSDEEIKKLKPEKTDTVDIVEFVDLVQLDPIYFNKHYYAAPEKEKEKAYFLLREALQITEKIAIGKFVLRNKEYVCALKAYKEGLLLSTLNYAYEIRDIGELTILKSVPKITAQEVELAEQLIDKIYKKEFDITKFKDTFAEDLKVLLKKKEKGEEIIVAKEKGRKITTEENVVEALKASLKKK